MEETLIKTVAGKAVNFTPNQAYAVTPHDTNTFQYGLLFVGVGGDIKVMPQGLDSFVTFKNIQDGSILPVYVKAVHTDTSATDMLILY